MFSLWIRTACGGSGTLVCGADAKEAFPRLRDRESTGTSYPRLICHSLATQLNCFLLTHPSRPPQFGLGLKTHALLTAAGIESVVVLDSAVAYVMAKVN